MAAITRPNRINILASESISRTCPTASDGIESTRVHPRGLPRIRHTGGPRIGVRGRRRYPEGQTRFRVKHGMTGAEQKTIPRSVLRGSSLPLLPVP